LCGLQTVVDHSNNHLYDTTLYSACVVLLATGYVNLAMKYLSFVTT